VSTYPFKTGDVCRLSFKWPQDARAERKDGSKERHAIIFSARTGAFMASPTSTVPPEPHEEKYAIKLSGMMKRQLGLPDPDRPSWVKTNYINIVDTPNPAIRKWAKRGDNELKFCLGNAPQGLLKAIEEKRALAIKEGAARPEQIERHNAAREMNSRAAPSAPKKNAPPVSADGDKNRRYLPNDPARHADRLKRIQGAAHDKHERKSAAKDARARPDRPGLEI
jgi:hypothetical protein